MLPILILMAQDYTIIIYSSLDAMTNATGSDE